MTTSANPIKGLSASRNVNQIYFQRIRDVLLCCHNRLTDVLAPFVCGVVPSAGLLRHTGRALPGQSSTPPFYK